MARSSGGKTAKKTQVDTRSYDHPTAENLLRPDVGTQAQFRKKRPPKTYRYDSSLSPALQWDGQSVRERGEWLLACITEAAALPAPHLFPAPWELKGADGTVLAVVRGLQDAVEQLARLGRPFLEWAGKAERLSFEVPTLPLFVHERLSTKGIIETLKGHRKKQAGGEQLTLFDLFGDPEHSITDQVLRAYEYRDRWTNRMILGDSLVVMSSLLEYEGLGGQVQMIYMDPPYGVKFGSNFQPFVRKRDVKHNEDEDLTREPEMVKAYRDTWELGLHSYLTYMRDRLLLARELLTPSGSIFVQISDENLHHVRELMDEVFGAENFVAVITFSKTSGFASKTIPRAADHILWYARELGAVRYRQLFNTKAAGAEKAEKYIFWDDEHGERQALTREERENPGLVPAGRRLYAIDNLVSQGYRENTSVPYRYNGKTYDTGRSQNWKTTLAGLDRLAIAGRLIEMGNSLMYKRFLDDFPAYPLNCVWTDTASGASSSDPKIYVVQTRRAVIERCLLMTTDPGDLVLDPTCGSGTTAYVAEQWGRRWITVDTSRVPLALARQRLLTATFPWYELKSEEMGPAGGFTYKRKQNAKGEEVGGIVPHVTLKSIANDEPPEEEVLVDRPEEVRGITRVSGPFCVEATIPTPVDWEGDGVEDSGIADVGESYGSFVDRMLEVLRRSPVLHLGGGRSVALKGIRRPAKTLSLSAEASVSGFDDTPRLTPAEAMQEALEAGGAALPFSDRPVAIVFGPENGAVAEKLVYEAAREAHAKSYAHLYVIGFAIQPVARELVERCEEVVGVPATYVQATPDLMMGDLLKNMRSSQIFSVCGLPEVRVRKVPPAKAGEPERFQVELLGLDVFDPATMETAHLAGDDVPAWLLDTDYNGLTFHVCQAFFPRTSAWESLRKALRGLYEESVWDHLAGATSAPFEAGDHAQVAVKVIDDRGNELLVVTKLGEVK